MSTSSCVSEDTVAVGDMDHAHRPLVSLVLAVFDAVRGFDDLGPYQVARPYGFGGGHRLCGQGSSREACDAVGLRTSGLRVVASPEDVSPCCPRTR